MQGRRGDKVLKLAQTNKDKDKDKEGQTDNEIRWRGQGANNLQAHMRQQKAHEAHWDKEVARQDQWFKALQHKFSLLQSYRSVPLPGWGLHHRRGLRRRQTLTSSEAASPLGHSQPGDAFHGRSCYFKEPKLQKSDIEHFLITFEWIAVACRWLKPDWAFHLKSNFATLLKPCFFLRLCLCLCLFCLVPDTHLNPGSASPVKIKIK